VQRHAVALPSVAKAESRRITPSSFRPARPASCSPSPVATAMRTCTSSWVPRRPVPATTAAVPAGNAETCTFNAPTAGTYYVNVRAYGGLLGVSLKGTISP